MSLKSLPRQTAALLILLLLLVAGCSEVRLVAPYDQKTEDEITKLYEETRDYLSELQVKFGTQAASYESNKEFYAKKQKELDTILLRVQTIPQNEITVEQVRLAQQWYRQTEALHQRGFQAKPVITELQSSFRDLCQSILTLEREKSINR